ncbi:MAG: acyltransferase [Planctomycetota bacterium]|nr:acyltransferase [Planctomycetota bacterium]
MLSQPVLLDGSGYWEQIWLGAVSAGWSGVDLFFVLSGFLITSILIEARGELHYFRNFFMRRILRIFPLYFGSLLLLFSLLNGAELRIWYFLFAQNWVPVFDGTYQPMALQPFWSLAVEEQFYLVWPVIICVLKPNHLPIFCMVTTAVAFAARCVASFYSVDPWIIATVTPFRLDALALGALVASWRSGADQDRLRKVAPIACLVAFTGLTLITVVEAGYHMNGKWSQTVGYTLFAMLCASLIALIVAKHPVTRLPRRFLQSQSLRHFGHRSYAIYVIHMPLFVFMNNVSRRQLAAGDETGTADIQCYFFAVVVSLILAEVSWHLFENPFLKLKCRFPRNGGDRLVKPTHRGVEIAPV